MLGARMLMVNKSLDGYTKSLLHMNGADASTIFTDETGKIWTRYGDAQISTAQSKFGGASGYFDGTGDYLTTPDSDDWFLGSGDFTFDMWVYITGTGILQYLLCQGDSINPQGFDFFVYYGDNILRFSTGGTARIAKTFTWSLDTWYHLACVRNGNTMELFVDGNSIGTQAWTGSVNNVAYPLQIGRRQDGNYFEGYIDELRISKGIARWTANFTPPASPY